MVSSDGSGWTCVRRSRRKANLRSLCIALNSRASAIGRLPASERMPAAATAHGMQNGGFLAPNEYTRHSPQNS